MIKKTKPAGGRPAGNGGKQKNTNQVDGSLPFVEFFVNFPFKYTFVNSAQLSARAESLTLRELVAISYEVDPYNCTGDLLVRLVDRANKLALGEVVS